jgi:hypothetical protein
MYTPRLQGSIKRAIEAYVNDIIVKSKKASDLVNDLHIVFNCFRQNGVKLNPKNASLGCHAACFWVTSSPSEA